MGIVDEDVVRVREAADIVQVVNEHTQLKRVGTQWTGLCPFHNERSGSLSVNGEQGVYYCFGCGAKGDVITFVREIEHTDFVGAVEWLAAKFGITLRYTDKDQGEGRKQRARLIEAMEKAVAFYHERLLAAADAGRARGYLRDRGLTGDEVRAYRIGWAPDAWDELAKALKVPDAVFEGAGLGKRNSRGRQTDRFRGRLLFPIFDVKGDPVAFGGRVLPGGDGAKYINSAESPIYSKSKVLYGLNWTKGAIVAADEAIVCEGYTDVIGFAAAGVPRAVATCGTALTEDHVRTLKSFARRVVLAFDADGAGQNAAARFYEWERAYDVDVAVAALPTGVDPADLARSDPAALAAAVDQAVPFLGFRVNRLLDAASLASPEGRARAAELAMAAINEHPSPLVRDQYLMEVASRCRIDPERLRSGSFAKAAGSSAAPRGRAVAVDATRGGTRRPGRHRDSPEVEALRMMIQSRADIEKWLEPWLFDDVLVREAYVAVAEADSVADASTNADPDVAGLIEWLAVDQTAADALDVVARLVAEGVGRQLAAMGAEVANTKDDQVVFDLAAQQAWAKLRVEELRDPLYSTEALEQLLPWLTNRSGESDDGE